MDEESKIKFGYQKQQRCRCIIAVVLVILAFFLGFVIGYFSHKTPSKDKTSSTDSRSVNKDTREKASALFQNGIDNGELESTVK